MEKKMQRSVRFPEDLVKWIEREGKANERNFTKQLTFLLRKVQKQTGRKEKVSA